MANGELPFLQELTVGFEVCIYFATLTNLQARHIKGDVCRAELCVGQHKYNRQPWFWFLKTHT